MLFLYNARIYTSPLDQGMTALAIDQKRIAAVGTDKFILGNYGQGSKLQDMNRAVIWPGLIDAHIHLQLFAMALQWIDCETLTQAACLDRVAKKAREIQPGKWLIGHGWNQNAWPEGLGNVSMLDQVAPDHPVFLTAKSLHAAWANSNALKAASISPDTPNPPGGLIAKDDQGLLTGILYESAMHLVQQAIPLPARDEIINAIREAQFMLCRFGITAVHDFDGPDCLLALQKLQQAGDLKIKVVKAIHVDDLPHVLSLGIYNGLGNAHLRLGPLKIFADGALGPHTSAMLQPYYGDSENKGILMVDANEISKWGQQAALNGFNLAVHAIGDHANRVVLDGLEKLRFYEQEQNLPALRHRIEHVQLIDPVDQPRLAALKITASMQPVHATSDMPMADRFWGLRSQNAYAWQSLLRQKTMIAFGSDAPVESPNPFWGLHAAVTRCRRDGTPGKDGWYPEQRLSLIQAVRGYTQGPAYAAGQENVMGKLAPGYTADLITFDEDPFTIPAENLFKISPTATMIDGEWIRV